MELTDLWFRDVSGLYSKRVNHGSGNYIEFGATSGLLGVQFPRAALCMCACQGQIQLAEWSFFLLKFAQVVNSSEKTSCHNHLHLIKYSLCAFRDHTLQMVLFS